MALIPDIEVTKDWQSIYTLSGIAVGTPINIQHKGHQDENVYLSAIAGLTIDDIDGRMLTERKRDAFWDGSSDLFVRCSDPLCSVHVEVA